MRPAVLQWKVALALVGVVVIAATLGSVLGPSQTNGRTHTFYISGVNSGLTGYTKKPVITVWLAPKHAANLGFLPADATLLDRLRAWLDQHVWGG
jgi:hypothetical protein